MNYRERMKEYLKESDEYSSQYGKWGTLNSEQRNLIKRLLREMDGADEVIKHQYFEIERLNNIIKTKDEGIKAFTEDLCEESAKVEKAIEYIENHTYHDTPKKLQNGIYERGELIIKNDFYIEDLVDILRGVGKE